MKSFLLILILGLLLKNSTGARVLQNTINNFFGETQQVASTNPIPIAQENRKESDPVEIGCPSTRTSLVDGCVKLRATDAELKDRPPRLVTSILTKTANTYPTRPAFKSFTLTADGSIEANAPVTYNQYLENVKTVAKAFLLLGLEEHHSVAIIGDNSPEWMYSYVAAIFAGGISIGMYTSNDPKACLHNINTSRAQIVVVQNDKQFSKIKSIITEATRVKAIIQYTGEPNISNMESLLEGRKVAILKWSQVMNLEIPDTSNQQRRNVDAILNQRINGLKVNKVCTIVFTSGTESEPKAVMLSHDNITYDAKAGIDHLGLPTLAEHHVLVSHLPLNHVAAQTIDIHLAMRIGATVVFPPITNLRDKLVDVLKEVQPTIFLTVPGIWNKIYQILSKKLEDAGIKVKITKIAATIAAARSEGSLVSYFADAFLNNSQIKESIGFRNCKVFASAATPLSQEVKDFFLSVRMEIVEAYGMSECSGAHTLGQPNKRPSIVEGVGVEIPGVTTAMILQTRKKYLDVPMSEICIYGRHVFMGYLGNEEKTNDSFLGDFYRTGDCGEYKRFGLMHITGRIKEFYKTIGGEMVSPAQVEMTIQLSCGIVKYAVCVGNGKQYITALIVLKTIDNTDLELDAYFKKFLKDSQLSVPKTLRELRKDTVAWQAVVKELKTCISAGSYTNNPSKPKKFAVLEAGFPEGGSEITPSLKLKRKNVLDLYNDAVENMYKNTNVDDNNLLIYPVP